MTSSSPPHDWFVLRENEQHGPFSADEMHAAARDGHLLASDHVWRDGLAEWQPAGSAFVLGTVTPSTAEVAAGAVVTPPSAPATAALPEAREAEPPPRPADAAATDPDADAPTVIGEPRPQPPPLPSAAGEAKADAGSGASIAVAATTAKPRAEERAAPDMDGASSVVAITTEPAQAKGAAPQWPMPVSAFLMGPYLQRSDVVLTRKNRDLKSWLIRWATNGSFSHAALVFLVPHQERGFNNSFVIESASSGVDLTNFMDYVSDRRSIVGIKRMTKPWFNEEVQARVRGRMLNTIKSTYSYATVVRLARELLADIAFGVKSRIYGPARAIQTRRDRQIDPPNKFICSGLVQMGFVQTLVDMAGEQRLPPEFLSDIVFREDLRQFLPTDWNEFSAQEQSEIMWEFATGFSDLLEAATPEDLASSPQLEWIYVIKRGLVYPATSDDHVRELLTWKPKKRVV